MLLQNGSTGSNVTYLQYGLRIKCFYADAIDSSFGTGTYNSVVHFQTSKGLSGDGIVGDVTWNALVADIKTVQLALNTKGYSLSVDGIAGTSLYNAITNFQAANNLTVDGMVGSATWSALNRSTGSTGSNVSDVTSLQYGLRIKCCYSGAIDGDFGTGTYNGVINYQVSKGLVSDGIAGSGTLNALATDIKVVQQALTNKGYSVSVDGIAGSITYNAIISFQNANSLTVDGMVGASTWAALNGSVTPEPTPNNGPISSGLVEFIKAYEGFRANKYNDGGGTPTIGYGSTTGWIMSYSTVTVAQATQALMEVLNAFSEGIKSDLNSKGVTLTERQFDSICSFAYNCGTGALYSSTLYSRICSGVRDSSLEANFEAWDHIGTQVSAGLLARRRDEYDMFMFGDYARSY